MMNDFEELTSLTALIEDEPVTKQQVTSKKKSLQPQVASMKSLQPQVASMNEEENLNPKAKQQTQKQAKKKTTSKNPRKQKRYTNATVGESSSKIMTSIIISEDVRDWLRMQSITSKQSMSQQIEELVKKEMKKAK